MLALPEAQILRRVFRNYRGERGMRLSQFGLQIMQCYFRSYEIFIPDDEVILPVHLIFLDERAALPFFLDQQRIVVFNAEVGVKLRLLDGRLAKLVTIEQDDI